MFFQPMFMSLTSHLQIHTIKNIEEIYEKFRSILYIDLDKLFKT